MRASTRSSRFRHQKGLSDQQLVLAWQSTSLLLGYPDEELLARSGLLREAAAKLPPSVSDPLLAFLSHLEKTPIPELAADFVATFDHQKRCCLYLTYFQHGDTRNRGVALLRFKTAYRQAGMVLCDEELPDHLGVLLEFGATADVAVARDLLLEHRAGLELLRLALEDAHSPWAHVLAAVSATLPPLAGDDREAVMKLAAAGPPAEEVGLAPFAPPEFLSGPGDGGSGGGGGSGGKVSLPIPTFTPAGARDSKGAQNGARP
ncbi:MAG: nitrate reductase molybdenum cofactor assembly chaperone NarJ/NarW [Actinomycetota bacterium]|nr:nitrate reductase molybdenum cofactor assembly chaperone NarJ/NarW [Actinomycetota bacterium]